MQQRLPLLVTPPVLHMTIPFTIFTTSITFPLLLVVLICLIWNGGMCVYHPIKCDWWKYVWLQINLLVSIVFPCRRTCSGLWREAVPGHLASATVRESTLCLCIGWALVLERMGSCIREWALVLERMGSCIRENELLYWRVGSCIGGVGFCSRGWALVLDDGLELFSIFHLLSL